MSEGCKIQFSHRKQQEWQNGGGSAQLNIAEVPESAQASAERVSIAGINRWLTGPARSDNVNLFLARALLL